LRAAGVGALGAFLVVVGSVPAVAQEEAEERRERSAAPQGVIEAFEVGAVEARTGALLLSGQAGGDVDGALTWSVSHRDEGGLVTVPFVVEVDGRSLLEGRLGANIVVGLYAYVVDDDGIVVDHIAQGIVLETEDYAAPIRGSGLKFIGRFVLPPGDYALRVMVRNQRTRAFFMSWSLMTLLSGEDPSPQLLPPIFPDDDAGWVVARQSGTAAVVELGDGAAIVPAARPVLLEDRSLELWLGGGGWDENARVGVRLLNDLGRTVSEPVVTFAGPSVGDFAFRRATLTPVDLPPGTYTLVVTLSDDQESQVMRRGLPVVVANNERVATWVAAKQSSSTSRVAPVANPEQVPKLSKKEIRRRYRRALAMLGEGDVVAARREVGALERQVNADPSPKAISNLGEAEYAESKALAKKEPQCLLPMALLHRQLYRSYMARQEGGLAIHSRQMTITYAQQLARLKPENGFSEALMVNLAADLAQAGAASAARDLLQRTLQLSPGYRPALLSLGFSMERSGDYIEAASTYRRLVDAHPGYEEGLLRLGINQIRIGRKDQGTEMLRELVGRGETPWVKTVAAQELVRFFMREDLQREAEREARLGIERLPQDQRLRILLGAILEQSGRHDEAVGSLTDLPAASRGVSPRARYGEWPSLGVRASQSHLTARATEAIPALQSAIAATGGAR
jgi:tetratricopeptide (TPR) repeat protein